MLIKQRTYPEHTELKAAGLHPLLARIYASRGVTSMEELPQGLGQLLRFDALKGIQSAIDLLIDAMASDSAIVIVGDFDADGATSTVVAVQALKAMGAQNVDFFAPNRFDYGYGLTPKAVQVVAERGGQLIITVDNGITSIEGVEAAHKAQIKVLITDHHLPGDTLPDADAIVNPNQPGDCFPSKYLAGVGVIYYVMLALRARLSSMGWFEEKGVSRPNMANYLDLVALGTVADVVPLDSNNRLLVQHGLKRIVAGNACLGIQALMGIAGLDPQQVVASDLAFAIAPRLNAAGRLDDMHIGIRCLLSDHALEAQALAKQLDGLNKQRRTLERQMHHDAQAIVDQLALGELLPMGVCLFDAKWHEGIVGIVASRIKEAIHRPVVVFTEVGDQKIKGSARSIPGLHIRDVLSEIAARYPGLLDKFGGHAMAAGLTLERRHFEQFCTVFDAAVQCHLGEEDRVPHIDTDGILPASWQTLETAALLRRGGPWGQGFPEPVFEGVFYLLDQRLMHGKHLKIQIKHQETGQLFDGIVFYVDTRQWPNTRCHQVYVVYQMDMNVYQGLHRLQLLVRHLEVAS